MKLDIKNDSALIVSELSRLLGLAPLVVMMVAVIMLIVTMFSVQDFLRLKNQQNKSQELPQFALQTQPLSPRLYQDYAAILGRLSPAVKVTAENDGLLVSIANPGDYAEFMYVLNSIQGLSKNAIWKAETLCLANCGGKGGEALIKGMLEKVEVKLRGSNE